ncbi:hypothetical protein ACFL1X_10340, partial [Candidatus Hydrogenedentota bacterium]
TVAITNDNGRFKVHVASKEGQALSVYHTAYAPASVEVETLTTHVRNVEIVLTAGGILEGILTFNDKPVANELIRAYYEDYHNVNLRTDETGGFRFERMGPGEVTVSAYLASEKRAFSLAAVIIEGGTTYADLTVVSGSSTIEGTVTLDGEQVERGRYIASVVTQNGIVVKTDLLSFTDGTYRVEKIPAGMATINILLEDEEGNEQTWSSSVDVGQGAIMRHDMRLTQ